MLCVGGSSSRAERAEELKATNKEEWPSESLSVWGEMREGGGGVLNFPASEESWSHSVLRRDVIWNYAAADQRRQKRSKVVGSLEALKLKKKRFHIRVDGLNEDGKNKRFGRHLSLSSALIVRARDPLLSIIARPLFVRITPRLFPRKQSTMFDGALGLA